MIADKRLSAAQSGNANSFSPPRPAGNHVEQDEGVPVPTDQIHRVIGSDRLEPALIRRRVVHQIPFPTRLNRPAASSFAACWRAAR